MSLKKTHPIIFSWDEKRPLGKKIMLIVTELGIKINE